MSRTFALSSLGLAATLVTAAAAFAATVGITSVVSAGATLSVSGGTLPTFNVTLNGVDQTVNYTLPVTVLDARGLALNAICNRFAEGVVGDRDPALRAASAQVFVRFHIEPHREQRELAA